MAYTLTLDSYRICAPFASNTIQYAMGNVFKYNKRGSREICEFIDLLPMDADVEIWSDKEQFSADYVLSTTCQLRIYEPDVRGLFEKKRTMPPAEWNDFVAAQSPPIGSEEWVRPSVMPYDGYSDRPAI